MADIKSENNKSLVFSIITVVLNDKKGLERTFKSVQAQICQNIQHIIVDGCSTDGSLEIIEKYRNDMTIVLSEQDDGIYDAMNKGIQLATGDVIQFLNAGDVYWDETVLSSVTEGFQSSNSKVVYGNNSYFDENDTTVRYWKAGNFSRWKLYLGWVPNHSTAFAKKELYDLYGGFNKKYYNAGDYEVFLTWFLGNSIVPYYLHKDVTKMEIGGFSNGSVKNMMLGMKEVRSAWTDNGYKYGILAPIVKIISKIPQKVLSRFS